MAALTDGQITFLEFYQQEFDATYGDGRGRSVREYSGEYAHRDDLFLAICSDLGVTPPARLVQPPALTVGCPHVSWGGMVGFSSIHPCHFEAHSEAELTRHLIDVHHYADDEYGEDTAQTNAWSAWHNR